MAKPMMQIAHVSEIETRDRVVGHHIGVGACPIPLVLSGARPVCLTIGAEAMRTWLVLCLPCAYTDLKQRN
jgi:hypothetical protein